MDIDSVNEVVRLSVLMGQPISSFDAEQALRPGRGYGNPQIAISWLYTEGGFEALQLQEEKSTNESLKEDKTDEPSKHFVSRKDDIGINASYPIVVGDTEGTSLNPIMIDDDLTEKLLVFADENGLHENVARHAALRCSSFNEGCLWMLTNPNHVDVPPAEFKCKGNSVIADRSGHWKCRSCTLVNDMSSSCCSVCDEPSPFRLQIMDYEEQLSKKTVENIQAKEEVARWQAEHADEKKRVKQLSRGLQVPDYWDQFPPGKTTMEVELIGTNGQLAAERDRIVNLFIDGGIGIDKGKIVSLKRIQNLFMWQRYAAQKALVAEKPSNRGNPNIQYLFHGPKGNTESIIKNGFVGQYGLCQPFGTWTHTSSQYSGGSFADVNPPGGGRRIFICQAAVGTPGKDNGSGRRPNEVQNGVLADCHQNGGIHVFYVDSQLYPEYLIHWR